MPVFINASEKKKIDSLYLTVEQVRYAANVWMASHDLPRAARKKRYREAAERIAYYQHRNQQARRSHTNTTFRRLRQLGIKVSRLRPSKPGNP